MKLGQRIPLLLALVVGCSAQTDQRGAPQTARTAETAAGVISLTEARRGHSTELLHTEAEGLPVEEPPAATFRVVHFESPVGKLAAYLSPPPGDGKRHPAIVWVVGGFSNSISGVAWADASVENDQSARAFREDGVVMMYPSFRGGNKNPGFKEAFYGEVDDLLAAVEYLRNVDYVDPERVYLGGHSTGGTLVLLAAAATDKLRAVFSFGPVEDPAYYGEEYLPFDVTDRMERGLRAPIVFINAIASPTFVFEGTEAPGNLDSLDELSRFSRNRLVRFYPVHGADHYSLLAPTTRLIAEKILQDEGPTTAIEFTDDEVASLMRE